MYTDPNVVFDCMLLSLALVVIGPAVTGVIDFLFECASKVAQRTNR